MAESQLFFSVPPCLRGESAFDFAGDLILLDNRTGAGEGTVIVVVGAEGTAEFGRAFSQWADRWVMAAGRGGERVIQIGRDGSAEPTTAVSAATLPSGFSAGSSTLPATFPATMPGSDKELLRAALASETAEANAPLWIVLIGHGTSDGKESKFNLRGPDVSDVELAEWLRPMKRPVAVIDCSSSSSPFLNRLSGRGRVVITATRSASEIQFAHFGEFMSAAIADPAADLDKDGQTSLLEAFLAASHRVDDFYKQAGRLVTEHALLDDNGDALGISADWFVGTHATRSARDGAAIDGARANQWCLVRSAAEQAIPAELRTQRDELELQIESLRAKKGTMTEAVYYVKLEAVLLKLAKVYQQIEGGKS